ncbi:MAG: hypothetical protein EOP48_21220 [Sphingobacteriales bacterium]|nr:MAG: hypothetical protein EOP48_21220 [Sphingobacteriales bacterium]
MIDDLYYNFRYEQVGCLIEEKTKIPEQWERAKDAMYRLEKPQPNLPYGIPYGVAVGNQPPEIVEQIDRMADEYIQVRVVKALVSYMLM